MENKIEEIEFIPDKDGFLFEIEDKMYLVTQVYIIVLFSALLLLLFYLADFSLINLYEHGRLGRLVIVFSIPIYLYYVLIQKRKTIKFYETHILFSNNFSIVLQNVGKIYKIKWILLWGSKAESLYGIKNIFLILIFFNSLMAENINGVNFKKLNVDKDFKVMKRGCESGVTPLCNNLAIAYSKGTQTIQKDLKQYEYYRNKMCEQKDYKTCDFMGKLYSNGYKEIKKDDKKSYQAFKIACDNANIDDSCFWVANFELFGEGGATKSFLKPERTYKRLCSKKHLKSCKLLKQFYKMVDIKTNRFYLAEKAEFEKQKQAKNYIIDSKTNLMWQDDNDTNTIKRNFKGAQKYCDELEMGGYDNWRLPNASELYSLVDETKNNNTKSIIKYSSFGSYVSSTFFDEKDKTLWFINFKNPHLRSLGALQGNDYVRCVRGEELPLDRKQFYIYWKRIINDKK